MFSQTMYFALKVGKTFILIFCTKLSISSKEYALKWIVDFVLIILLDRNCTNWMEGNCTQNIWILEFAPTNHIS